MTLAFGAAGLTIDTTAEAAQAIGGNLAARFGQTLQWANPNTVVGNLVASVADVTVEVQDGLQAVYSQLVVTSATGTALDTLALLVGLPRNLATRTLGTLTVSNASGSPVNIPQGALFVDDATQEQYAVVSATTVGASTSAAVAVRAIPTGALVVGTGAYSVLSSFAGAVSLSAVGLATTSQGTAQETDAEFRLRIVSDGARAGRGTLASILAAVRDVDGVTDAKAFENTTLLTGIASPVAIPALPPKSFVVVVQGGSNDDVAAAIYDTAPAGIASYGDTTVSVDTGEGYSVSVLLERPAAVTIYVSATITGAGSTYEAAVVESITSYIETLPNTVLYNRILCAVLDALPSTANVSALTMGTAPSPVATSNIAVAWNEYPTTSGAAIVLTWV